jgi:hypothetical protein
VTALAAFGRFWWDFVVGDDPFVALGVVLALAVTGLLNATGVAGWWLLPLAVPVVLAAAVWGGVRRGGAAPPHPPPPAGDPGAGHARVESLTANRFWPCR